METNSRRPAAAALSNVGRIPVMMSLRRSPRGGAIGESSGVCVRWRYLRLSASVRENLRHATWSESAGRPLQNCPLPTASPIFRTAPGLPSSAGRTLQLPAKEKDPERQVDLFADVVRRGEGSGVLQVAQVGPRCRGPKRNRLLLLHATDDAIAPEPPYEHERKLKRAHSCRRRLLERST